MKKTIQLLTAFATLAFSALTASAQPAVKIVTVDVAKILDGHYKTAEVMSKIREAQEKAQAEVEKMNGEGNTLVQQYNELAEQAKAPVLSTEAKAKVETSIAAKSDEIQKKRAEIDQFQQRTNNSLQQRVKVQRDLILEEINKVIIDIAKKRSATMVFDKTGPSLLGVPTIVYSEPQYDITDDVMTEINKTRPVVPTTTSSAPATGTTSTGITVPGLSK